MTVTARRIDGKAATLRAPRAAMDRDIAYLSENRRADGLIEELASLDTSLGK